MRQGGSIFDYSADCRVCRRAISHGKHVLYVYTPSPSRCRTPPCTVFVRADVFPRCPSSARRSLSILFRPVADLFVGSASARVLCFRSHSPQLFSSCLQPSQPTCHRFICPVYGNHVSIRITAFYLPVSLPPNHPFSRLNSINKHTDNYEMTDRHGSPDFFFSSNGPAEARWPTRPFKNLDEWNPCLFYHPITTLLTVSRPSLVSFLSFKGLALWSPSRHPFCLLGIW